MKIQTIPLLVLLLAMGMTSAQAAPFRVDIEFSQSDDEFSDLKKPRGWSRTEDGLARSFEVKRLPWQTTVSNTTFEISRTGIFKASYSYGDSDGTVRSSFNLPKQGGKFILGDRPCKFALSGGDQASGSWGMNAKVVVSLLKEALPLPAEALSEAEWEAAKAPNSEGYLKMDEDLQQWADDPADPRKFRAVATPVKSNEATLRELESWLNKNFVPRGLKFWVSRSKGNVTLYGNISLVTEALAHDKIEYANAR